MFKVGNVKTNFERISSGRADISKAAMRATQHHHMDLRDPYLQWQDDIEYQDAMRQLFHEGLVNRDGSMKSTSAAAPAAASAVTSTVTSTGNATRTSARTSTRTPARTSANTSAGTSAGAPAESHEFTKTSCKLSRAISTILHPRNAS